MSKTLSKRGSVARATARGRSLKHPQKAPSRGGVGTARAEIAGKGTAVTHLPVALKPATRAVATGQKVRIGHTAAGTVASATIDKSKHLVHTALRLHPDVRRSLEALRASLGGTLNGLMNEGLAEFVAMRSAAVELDMKRALERIKAYRRADPAFARDHLEIAQDEVATRGADPVEGTPYRAQHGPSLASLDRILAGGC